MRDEEDKNEVCTEPGCGKRFVRRTDLYRHQRIKHGAQLKRRRSTIPFLMPGGLPTMVDPMDLVGQDRESSQEVGEGDG